MTGVIGDEHCQIMPSIPACALNCRMHSSSTFSYASVRVRKSIAILETPRMVSLYDVRKGCRPYSATTTLRSQRLVNGRVKLGCLLAFTAGKGEGLEASSFPARLTHTTTRSFLPSNVLMHHCKPHLNMRELLVDKGSLCLLQGQVSARHW